MKFLAALIALLALAIPARAQDFDSYVLALSWSPSYCASPGAAKRDPMQCGVKRGFIVHGLWPQAEDGPLDTCPPAEPKNLPTQFKRQQSNMIPSLSLIEHEWDRHGGCTGLTPETYFGQMRKIASNVYFPLPFRVSARPPATTTAAALRAEFLKVNRSLKPDAIAIVCRKQELQEVRLCFSKSGASRACGRGVRDTCPMGKISVPAASAP